MNLIKWINKKDLEKIEALNNPKVEKVIDEYLTLCSPEKAVVIDDSPEDIAFVRQMATDFKEEIKLAIDGHTVHYDGYYDQARDKGHTATLLPEGQQLSRGLNVVERESGLKEILTIMDGAMQGKTMIIRFFCLGPTNSRFSISALQITDSFYVAHSEDILYRPGYEQFKKLNDKDDFFVLVFDQQLKILQIQLTQHSCNSRDLFPLDSTKQLLLSVIRHKQYQLLASSPELFRGILVLFL